MGLRLEVNWHVPEAFGGGSMRSGVSRFLCFSFFLLALCDASAQASRSGGITLLCQHLHSVCNVPCLQKLFAALGLRGGQVDKSKRASDKVEAIQRAEQEHQINCPIPCIGSSNKRPHHMLAFAPTSSPFPSPIPGEPRTDDPGSCLTSFRGDEDGIARRLCDGSVLYPGETLYAFPGSVFFSPEESNSSFVSYSRSLVLL
ncbi:hypothetical protein GUITHDRAFT_122359 [Guillardia theta CCMP2712]|uniref:Uncharacterized protein n=1 Tax=Guillardia theta (strain CCMP2712) TaxID=905079 RepID=L1I5D7_GUITC|nr:hypothetical protein GUITHDRAFT_122359 [Guillardia theta CCMP2712]EKX31451.1 hypothetical protein GUITHDRAFT_122359 [Guillardia theta CCMP2712]|eukprot:XP_005818431.1 hypothetical protein GUITHDRAFT_122359 [Guillardia theta CCMP2712]